MQRVIVTGGRGRNGPLEDRVDDAANDETGFDPVLHVPVSRFRTRNRWAEAVVKGKQEALVNDLRKNILGLFRPP